VASAPASSDLQTLTKLKSRRKS